MEYIPLAEAAKQLGMTRATLYNYMESLGIVSLKFERDKRHYVTPAHIRAIKTAKEKSWMIPELREKLKSDAA